MQKYLETVSSVLEDAKKNDIIPFNPAHRVRKRCAEKEKQHIPQKYEMQRLLKIIMDEPILYKAYYTMAIATGLRRGELCALRWEDITGPFEFTIRHSRSYVAGQGIVESDTKNHRERVIVIPAQVWEFLMSLRHWQTIRSGKPENNQPIFTDLDGHVPNPDTFTRHLRRLYAKNGFRRSIICTRCGIITQRTCCRRAPANRLQLTCWGTRIQHFWNVLIATRRIWQSVRRRI